MERRVIIVTGANSGIGEQTARGLAEQGATVVMACRSRQRAAEASRRIEREVPEATLDFIELDLSSFESIRTFVDEFKRRYERLDVLVNNAGVMSRERRLSADGYELTFAVNHLGPFLLSNLLLDVLRGSAPARVVNIASSTHRQGSLDFDDLQLENDYRFSTAYANAKLGTVLFTQEMARRVDPDELTVNCLHPGGTRSNFIRELPKVVQWAVNLFLASPERAARAPVYLALSADVEKTSGKYFVHQKLATPATEDRALAQKLWDVSAELTGL